MIRRLGLTNFKCFEDVELELAPLTVLAGSNGVGKSSIIQSLLLLRQSFKFAGKNLADIHLALNGSLARLGRGQDVLFEDAQKEEIGIRFTEDDGTYADWRFTYSALDDILLMNRYAGARTSKGMAIFSTPFQYLEAERLGPRTTFRMAENALRDGGPLGTKGEFTAHFLSEYGDRHVVTDMRCHPVASQQLLRYQVEAWADTVTPGVRLVTTANPNTDQVEMRYSFAYGKKSTNDYRTTNVGFGMTYSLPIIVAALSLPEDKLLLVENPEAHLHPRSQTAIATLLCRAAASGLQIIVETHSDHVLNAVRKEIHGGYISPDDVSIYYFNRASREAPSVTIAHPRIDEHGRLDFWPDGFFDEWEKSLASLMLPRSKRHDS